MTCLLIELILRTLEIGKVYLFFKVFVTQEIFFCSEIFENFAAHELDSFVKENMKKYFELVQCKVDSEADVGDTGILVQALDRFYRRIEANTLCRDINFAK